MSLELLARESESGSAAKGIKTPLNICFVSQNAFGALSGRSTGPHRIGGVQKQTALMARWLADHGHRVSVITWDEGQDDAMEVQGVRIFKLCRPSEGIPGVRFFFPRLLSLYQAMARVSADIYYQNNSESTTGLVAAWCARHHKAFIYSVASESECDPRLPRISKPWERALYRYGLKSATEIIVQSAKQRRMLAEGFDLPSIFLPMPSTGPWNVADANSDARKDLKITWVGRVDPNKRLEWFLELAERLPEASFRVVAAEIDTRYASEMHARASSLPNVEWLDSIPWEEMGTIYEQAACLCCTSIHEGFPNTFLEAWSYGKPVISTFDPDGLIGRAGLGQSAESVQGLLAGIRNVLCDKAAWQECGRRAQKYFEENHQLDVAMRRFESVFMSVASALSIL